MVLQIVVSLLSAVLVGIHIHLVSCFGLWLADDRESVFLQLLDFVALEVPGFFFRLRVRVLIGCFDPLLRLFLVLWFVDSLLCAFVVVRASAFSPSLASVLALLSVAVLPSVGPIIFSGLWPFFLGLFLGLSLLGLLSFGLRQFCGGGWGRNILLRLRIYD